MKKKNLVPTLFLLVICMPIYTNFAQATVTLNASPSLVYLGENVALNWYVPNYPSVTGECSKIFISVHGSGSWTYLTTKSGYGSKSMSVEMNMGVGYYDFKLETWGTFDGYFSVLESDISNTIEVRDFTYVWAYPDDFDIITDEGDLVEGEIGDIEAMDEDELIIIDSEKCGTFQDYIITVDFSIPTDLPEGYEIVTLKLKFWDENGAGDQSFQILLDSTSLGNVNEGYTSLVGDTNFPIACYNTIRFHKTRGWCDDFTLEVDYVEFQYRYRA